MWTTRQSHQSRRAMRTHRAKCMQNSLFSRRDVPAKSRERAWSISPFTSDRASFRDFLASFVCAGTFYVRGHEHFSCACVCICLQGQTMPGRGCHARFRSGAGRSFMGGLAAVCEIRLLDEADKGHETKAPLLRQRCMLSGLLFQTPFST